MIIISYITDEAEAAFTNLPANRPTLKSLKLIGDVFFVVPEQLSELLQQHRKVIRQIFEEKFNAASQGAAEKVNYDWIRFIYVHNTNTEPEGEEVEDQGYVYDYPTPGIVSGAKASDWNIDWDMLNMWQDTVTPPWRLWNFNGSLLHMRIFPPNRLVGDVKLDAMARHIFPGKAKLFDLVNHFRHVYDDQPSPVDSSSSEDDDDP